jgi:hypothetical protein
MSTSLSGLSNNYFPSPQNGFTTTTSGSVASGATSVGLNSVAGYTNGQVAVFVIDPTDSNKKQTFTGVIDTSGVQVTSVVWTAGTNQAHALGATVVDYATATHIAMISKGTLVSLDQDGTLKAGAVDNAAALASNVVTTAKVIDDAITDAKLIYGKVRSRQGGSATNWGTTGTTTYDYSGADTFIQVGSKAAANGAGTDTAVTFPTAFNQVPLVLVVSNTANTANQVFAVNSVTTTGFNIRANNAGAGSETCAWMAVGQ